MGDDENVLINDISKNISLTEDEINYFQSRIELRIFKKKEYLHREGNIVRNFFFVESGCIKKNYINSEGKQRIFEFATERQWIGDQHSLWNRSPSMFNIIALEESKVILISRDNLSTLFDHIPKFERYFRIVDNHTIRKQELRIKQGLACSAEERYSDFSEAYPGLELRIAQKEIASFLGVSPEFLSTMRKKK